MPLPALAGPLLIQILIAFAFKLLIAFGIGIATYTVAIPALIDTVSNAFSVIPLEFLQILGQMQVDKCITIIMSAYLSKLTYTTTFISLSNFGSQGN